MADGNMYTETGGVREETFCHWLYIEAKWPLSKIQCLMKKWPSRSLKPDVKRNDGLVAIQ